MIIVNGWKPLTIITKHSILHVAAALDPPLDVHLEAGVQLRLIKQLTAEPLTVITKRSILDVAAALDPPLNRFWWLKKLETPIQFRLT